MTEILLSAGLVYTANKSYDSTRVVYDPGDMIEGVHYVVNASYENDQVVKIANLPGTAYDREIREILGKLSEEEFMELYMASLESDTKVWTHMLANPHVIERRKKLIKQEFAKPGRTVVINP
jgi:hypothetical protein